MPIPDPTLAPVQMLWIRGDLSRLELLSVRSFLAQGHPVHLYSYDPPTNLPAAVRVLPADEIVPAHLAPTSPVRPFAKGSMGAFSDYFRYHLLLARGGWWADMDVIALKPWRGFPDLLVAGTEEKDVGRIANGFVMRFPAGHPVLADCLRALDDKPLSGLDISETGPLLLHRVLGRERVAAISLSPAVFAPVPWNSSEQLVRPRWRAFVDNLKHRLRRPHLACHFTRDTVAVHLWNETWRDAGLDKNALYPASSLYERLQRRYPPAP